MNVIIINGPNLNLLGKREPHIYGHETYDQLMERCITHGARLAMKVETFQSNHEGALIEAVHGADGRYEGLMINAGGYSHTSVALRDALSGISVPAIEVHLSNIYARESFRHHSLLSAVCKGVICGLGSHGYFAALEAMARWRS
ncbi:MAG: type II 3-dehydroquinate dehydratase [Alphaproteobacteria bacterium]|nr:type II 3-dehydroquinate dehydratase [Alphaproteobacteria bacterium]NDC56794.1 type II 3-dehydroquinate dehydratase [Alphaproteobacteria bacterium]NDG04639.1 type II 3-dehydroquinate dehydratase [Alphaproteobacteria bacterium]